MRRVKDRKKQQQLVPDKKTDPRRTAQQSKAKSKAMRCNVADGRDQLDVVG